MREANGNKIMKNSHVCMNSPNSPNEGFSSSWKFFFCQSKIKLKNSFLTIFVEIRQMSFFFGKFFSIKERRQNLT